MGIYNKLKKNTGKKLSSAIEKQKEIEKIPTLVKRCPKCYKLTLEYDSKTRRIYCASCGFEAFIPVIK